MIPAVAAIGLRHPHLPGLAAEPAGAPLCAPWVEVHSENFLCAGGPRLAMLDAVAARYPLSCHGVGLSLGSAEGLSREHLARLKTLFSRVKPALISEHLSWSVTGGIYLNDLLPLPYTEETLGVVSRNVDAAQQAFGARILVENPSAYLNFPASTMSEVAFLRRLVKNTGCGLLLDVNNVYVSATNNAFAARAYLEDFPGEAVGEIHLAGHSVVPEDGGTVLVDTHSTHVCGEVWAHYESVIARVGPRPTLIEWDLEIPALEVLLAEAARAQAVMDARAAIRVA
ncbi:MAG: DUF692 domain-containing protein [Rhodospirillaceae bacterium]|nr:DUF692 domain-containing protein [Rhodospirillaceae bacterium]